MKEKLESFWAIPAADLMGGLETTQKGLTAGEAQARLTRFGPNSLRPAKRLTSLSLLIGQFKSPITIILLVATVLAFFLGDAVDAAIILVIILASGLLGFWQERGATNAIARLLAIVQIKSTALRDGQVVDVKVEDIVPGDIVLLNAGDVIPGDCLALDSRDLFIDEASLTGETFPVEKKEGTLPAETPLSQRTNALYMGTHVVSGTGTAVVVKTGTATEFGKISDRLKLRPPETEFEHGIRHFGFLLMEVTLILVIAIFAINVFFKRPVLEALLFALALAVGLTPQLLPAIISINLSHGASKMAQKKVIVKRLASIENFGSMNILCADKTGTLTEGTIHLHGAIDISGKDSARVLLLAYLNSIFEAGFNNPIDEAIRSVRNQDTTGYSKLDEVPYDFNRKRLTILVSKAGISTMITKGAVENILDVCSTVENVKGEVQDIGPVLDDLKHRYQDLSTTGYRTLGLAYKPADGGAVIKQTDEKDMTFLGFLVFHDPLKDSIAQTVEELKRVGVTLKI
ncbi:MAG: cation-translocating P-type ATPase, partial [Dehalococcoidia bacterium]